MDYFEKIENNPYEDLYWNISEKKQGAVNVIGGNGQSFRTEVKVAEYLAGNYPAETVNTVLPETLKNKLPPVENFKFLPATEGGTFSGEGLVEVINGADFNLIIGDLSKNAVTGKAVVSACEVAEKMTLVTRDTVDIIAENGPEKVLMNENMIIFGSRRCRKYYVRCIIQKCYFCHNL